MSEPEKENAPAIQTGAEEKKQTVTGQEPNVNQVPGRDAVSSRGDRPGKGGAWIWQDKWALARIVKTFGTKATNGIAVYVVLTLIFSERKAAEAAAAKAEKRPEESVNPFRESINVIAYKAGMHYRTAIDTLHALETEAKVIAIERVKFQKGKKDNQSLYTILQKTQSARVQDLQPERNSDCKRRRASFADNQNKTPVGGIKTQDVASPLARALDGAQPGEAEADSANDIHKAWA